jgi:hypothetical protein
LGKLFKTLRKREANVNFRRQVVTKEVWEEVATTCDMTSRSIVILLAS